MTAPRCLLVGAYGDGDGPKAHLVDLEGERFVAAGAYSSAPCASWMVRSRSGDLLYAVEEQAEGSLGVHVLSAPSWSRVARSETGGAAPCYLSLDAAESRLAVANYASGSVALFDLDEIGVPVEPPRMIVGEGGGPVKDRQDGPHAHCAVFGPDGALYHTDLGADRVYRTGIALDGSLGDRAVAFAAPAGAGPRHLVFHPHEPLALLVCELDSSLTVLETAGEVFQVRDRRSTLPAGCSQESLGGHLALNGAGDRVYVSNRGHDSLAVFELRPDGRLALLQHVASGGASPRHFRLWEEAGLLAVANEEGGSLVLFRIMSDGSLEPTGSCHPIPGAAFVLGVD